MKLIIDLLEDFTVNKFEEFLPNFINYILNNDFYKTDLYSLILKDIADKKEKEKAATIYSRESVKNLTTPFSNGFNYKARECIGSLSLKGNNSYYFELIRDLECFSFSITFNNSQLEYFFISYTNIKKMDFFFEVDEGKIFEMHGNISQETNLLEFVSDLNNKVHYEYHYSLQNEQNKDIFEDCVKEIMKNFEQNKPSSYNSLDLLKLISDNNSVYDFISSNLINCEAQKIIENTNNYLTNIENKKTLKLKKEL